MPRLSPVERTPITADELAGIDVLRGQERHLLTDIAARATRLRFAAKKTILEPRDPSTDIYFIISGTVRVRLNSPGGRRITYHLLRTGQLFGELAAVDGEPRSAGISSEIEVVLARVDARTFQALLRQYPDFAFVMMVHLTALARWLSEKIFEYHAYNVTGRICAELLRLAAQAGRLEFTVTDADMAGRVGTTRENVNKIIGQIKRKDALVLAREKNSSEFRILDLPRLKKLLKDCEIG